MTAKPRSLGGKARGSGPENYLGPSDILHLDELNNVKGGGRHLSAKKGNITLTEDKALADVESTAQKSRRTLQTLPDIAPAPSPTQRRSSNFGGVAISTTSRDAPLSRPMMSQLIEDEEEEREIQELEEAVFATSKTPPTQKRLSGI
ncbi:MAG: hypothetical protein Q9214_004208 [Letrouitia sp. 1 TL-2023]